MISVHSNLNRALRTYSACVLAFAAESVAFAQERSQEAPPAARWVLKAEALSCSLGRSAGPSGGAAFEVAGAQNGSYASLLIADPALKPELVRSKTPAEILMLPAGRRIAVEAVPMREMGLQGRGLVLRTFDSTIPDAFASANGFAVEIGGKRIVETSFTGASKAFAALRRCNDELLREWGVDPAVNAALLKPPRGTIAQFISYMDYPDDAIRRRAQGTTVMRFTVAVDGRIRDCAVAVSSGDAALDRASCQLVTRRARLEPAVGPDGKIVEAMSVAKLTWVLP